MERYPYLEILGFAPEKIGVEILGFAPEKNEDSNNERDEKISHPYPFSNYNKDTIFISTLTLSVPLTPLTAARW